MSQSKIRIAQQKTSDDKSIYITLPIKETGISPGDSIMFEVVNKGTIILHKLRKGDIEESKSVYDKIISMLGIGKHYELRDANEQIEALDA